MTSSPDDEIIERVDGVIVNSHDEIGERKSVGSDLPQAEQVIFTRSKIKIPSQELEIPYPSIRDFRSFALWDGEMHKSAIITLPKYKATKTTYWRMILEDRTYFTLSKCNTNIQKATRAGAVDITAPNISEEVAEIITTSVEQPDKQSVTYVPVEYMRRDGKLRVEGWKSGASSLDAGIDGSATTAGASVGLETGPVSFGGSASKSSISGEINGEIGDNTYSKPIHSFLLFEDKLIIDSELRLELFYDEIDRVTVSEDGLIIDVGETTYRAEVHRCKDSLDEIHRYVDSQIDENSASSDGDPQSTSVPEKLTQLKELQEEGIITEAEFETKKSKLLEEF